MRWRAPEQDTAPVARPASAAARLTRLARLDRREVTPFCHDPVAFLPCELTVIAADIFTIRANRFDNFGSRDYRNATLVCCVSISARRGPAGFPRRVFPFRRTNWFAGISLSTSLGAHARRIAA